MADDVRRPRGPLVPKPEVSRSRAAWLVPVLAVAGLVIWFTATPSDRSVEAPAAAAVPVTPLEAPAMPAPEGREIFAAPDGQPTNPGTRQQPVDLATALSSNSPAAAGDTVWLRGGTYAGNFVSTIAGTEDRPIHVRQMPGERATITAVALDEPALAVDGVWTWFRDFSITLVPLPQRRPLESEELDLRKSGGVVVRGAHVALVNLVVHDLPRGIEVASGASGTLIADNIVYHTGWRDSPRGTGIHSAAGAGDQYVVGNIVFGQGGAGIAVNMNRSDRLLLEGNTSFDNGVTGEFFDRNIVVEGGTMRIVRNFTYYRPGRRGGENNFGYGVGCQHISAEANYWAHAESYPVNLTKCEGEVTGNTFIGNVDSAFLTRYPANSHLRPPYRGLQSFVVPSRYESSRATIVVYNWDRHAAVNLDVTDAGLAPGTAYELRDALNYFATPVAKGIYAGGKVNVPIGELREAGLTGTLPSTLGHTAPEFLVFVLTKTVADDGQVK